MNNYILLRSRLLSGCGCTPASMSYVLTLRLKLVQYWQIHFWRGSGGESQYIPLLSCTYADLQCNVADWCPCFSLVMVVSTHSFYSNKYFQRRSYLLLSCFHNYNNTNWLIFFSLWSFDPFPPWLLWLMNTQYQYFVVFVVPVSHSCWPWATDENEEERKEGRKIRYQSHYHVIGTWSFQAKHDPSEIRVNKSTQSRRACDRGFVYIVKLK
jgi:hypothetical protein